MWTVFYNKLRLSFNRSKPLKWSFYTDFYSVTEKSAATYILYSSCSQWGLRIIWSDMIWTDWKLNCQCTVLEGKSLMPPSSPQSIGVDSLFINSMNQPFYIFAIHLQLYTYKMGLKYTVTVLIQLYGQAGFMVLYCWILFYCRVLLLICPSPIGPHREWPDWWLLLNLMTFWDPLAVSAKVLPAHLLTF